MKKILSLLAMLMITVMAFATDYTDQLTFKLTVGSNSSEKSLPQGTLTIEKRVDGTYNVTASGCDFSAADFGNWGDISCDGVAGTTNADGLTTIEVSNPEVFANGSVPNGYSLSGKSLLVKFNGTKAYALLKGKLALNAIVGYPFEYTFGTDEGFDGGSTGGGETGGEDKPAIVDVVEADYAPNGASFGFPFTINWETQKLVAKLDLSTCSRYTHNEGIISVGTDNGNGDVSLWEPKSGEANCHLYYTHYYYGSDAKLLNLHYLENPSGTVKRVDNSLHNLEPGLVVFTFDKDGLHVGDDLIATPDQMATLYNSTSLIFGSKEGSTRSNATYKYVKVVPLDWTEVPPVTVAETFTYDQDAFVGPNDTKGTANVKVYKMTDDSYTMEITAPVATKVGVITVGEDAKGRTTYMGEVESSVVSGVKYVVNGVVYEEGGAKHLYMTLTHDDDTYIIGENPDAPKVVSTLPFENVAYTTSMGGNGTATVTFTEMSDGTFPMTFVSDDLNVKAENLTKGTDEKGRTTYTGTAKRTDVDVTFTVKAVVYGETTAQKLYMTMDNGSSFVVTVGEDPDYVAPDEPKDVTVVEKYQADGTGFSKTINVDWDKQKIVASIDFSNGGDDKDILAMTTGESFTAFQTSTYRTMHWYCNQTDKQVSGFFAKSGAGNNNTGRIDVTDCLAKFEISKAEGLKVNGEVKMTPTALEELLTGDPIIIGSGESPKFSKAYYNYIKVVSLDWTEPTEPEVTVKDTKTFNEALYMQDQKVADATVVVKEMSDETINMSLKFGENEYTSTELTKGTDTKGRTTYTGKVANGDQTYDVAGVVYEKDNVARLYMTMTTSITTVVVGENPDATPEAKPVVYKNTLKVVRGTNTQTYENAEVSVLAKGEGMYEVTLPKFSDMDNVPGEWGPITFQAKGVEESGKVVLTATDQEFTLTNTGWKNDVVKVSMKGEIESEMLKATINVNHSSMSGYNYTLYYGVEAPEVVTEESNKTYKSNLRIADQTSEDENAYLFQTDEATVNIIKYSDKTYKITLKQITLNSKTSDLVFTGKAVESEVDPGEGGVVETEGTMVQATADAETQNFLGGAVNAQFMWQDISGTEIRMSFVLEGKTLSLGGEFNYEKKDPDTPDPELFCKENYVADGTGFEWDINVDWDTQKIVMSIDPSTCTGTCEDVIGLGAAPTAWDNTLHLYRTSADQQLQGYFQTSAGNNNTGKFAETAPFLVEVSKAQGFVVNNEVKIAASAMSDLFTLSTVKMGTGEGANDKSRATYNYVKVVDKDWTAPKDPDTGINATTVAEGEVEFFTVNGVKLNKLQKGLNIVRTADGKVKKVLVK